MIINGMGIDLEDYYHVSAFENILSDEDKENLPRFIVSATNLLLKIFEKYNIKATFFCLGLVAQDYPDLIRKIHHYGHEIAAHSMTHKRVRDMDAESFLKDAIEIKKLLEDIIGAEVIGYRAPSFSIGKDTPFFYDCLEQAGYKYSSSLNPIKHDHYGDETAPRFAFYPEGSKILEIPVTTAEYFGKRIPAGGGGWFRLMPYFLYRFLIKQTQKQQKPIIFYTHPWEFSPEQPVIEGLDSKTKFRHYVNLEQMESKFDSLCRDYKWGRMDEFFEKEYVIHNSCHSE